MNVGDLCRVLKKNTHTSCQLNHLVLIIRDRLFPGAPAGVVSLYVEGWNLKTNAFHHYAKTDLEVISESR